ncbi:hypothetical protein B9Z55_027664 [Caenorhabditis nigoni]|uniref:Uncharacterized protein n=1 Tax=Caenorhabditis nigoni TaxID=1611254 RepID=A0A2G5SF94_9PELO|nr:hypothetical protein B9Z55_027664 [Caenorhabditis nigoni]
MDDALEFYRQPEKGSRALSAMTSRFRWIKNNNDIIKLREYEMDRDNFKEKHTTLLKLLSSRMYEVVKEKFENGMLYIQKPQIVQFISVHVRDIEKWLTNKIFNTLSQ